jgi:hypothetical protein
VAEQEYETMFGRLRSCLKGVLKLSAACMTIWQCCRLVLLLQLLLLLQLPNQSE